MDWLISIWNGCQKQQKGNYFADPRNCCQVRKSSGWCVGWSSCAAQQSLKGFFSNAIVKILSLLSAVSALLQGRLCNVSLAMELISTAKKSLLALWSAEVFDQMADAAGFSSNEDDHVVSVKCKRVQSTWLTGSVVSSTLGHYHVIGSKVTSRELMSSTTPFWNEPPIWGVQLGFVSSCRIFRSIISKISKNSAIPVSQNFQLFSSF